MFSLNDTITAISTTLAPSAIAIIRISGPKSLLIYKKITNKKKAPTPRLQNFVKLKLKQNTIDSALVTYFKAPKSYTGEDMLEISCHGGTLVTQKILQLTLDFGARIAEKGEFTARAYLNSKLNLTQAEAVNDIIQAKSDVALNTANNQLQNALTQKIDNIADDIKKISAQIEANLDFPDEDINPNDNNAIINQIKSAISEIQKLLKTADKGKILRNGAHIVLYGNANVGKSSLLNKLLGYNRAIVTPIAGTTTDTIEEFLQIKGIPIKITDTAGLNPIQKNKIQDEALKRTSESLKNADIILHVSDITQKIVKTQNFPTTTINVLNKCDLSNKKNIAKDYVKISCKENIGLDKLINKILEKLNISEIDPNQKIYINSRHKKHLSATKKALKTVKKSLLENIHHDLCAVDLRLAISEINKINKYIDTEDILGEIFSKFCIGK